MAARRCTPGRRTSRRRRHSRSATYGPRPGPRRRRLEPSAARVPQDRRRPRAGHQREARRSPRPSRAGDYAGRPGLVADGAPRHLRRRLPRASTASKARSPSSVCCTPSASAPRCIGGRGPLPLQPRRRARQQTLTDADVVHVKGLSRSTGSTASARSARPAASSASPTSSSSTRSATSTLAQRAARPRRRPQDRAGSLRSSTERYIEALRNRAAGRTASSSSRARRRVRRRSLGKLDDSAVRGAAPPRRPGDRAGLPDPAAHARRPVRATR